MVTDQLSDSWDFVSKFAAESLGFGRTSMHVPFVSLVSFSLSVSLSLSVCCSLWFCAFICSVPPSRLFDGGGANLCVDIVPPIWRLISAELVRHKSRVI